MSEGKHTPGRWYVGSKAGYGAHDGVAVREERGLVLAVAIGDVPELKADANARLIAAAPDLLAALQALVANPAFELGSPKIEGRKGPRKTAAEEAWNGFVANAHAAIARATQDPDTTAHVAEREGS